MMKHARFLALMFPLLIFSRYAAAEDIVSLVRDLNGQQNRMATGDVSARASTAKQFDLIEKALERDDINGADEKTVRAIIIYFLCGGAAPKDKNKILSGSSKFGPLLNASLLYAEGKDGGVPKELMLIDPKSVSQILGGHLALIQAGALIGSDNARAVGLLDLARLLMPGSLVEEAALRREVAILDPVREVDKIVLLSFRYVSLYSKSPYAKNFWDTLRRLILGESASASASKFVIVFDKAPPELKATLNLELARQALIEGRFEDARVSIERASSVDDTDSQKRVELYRSILASLKDDKLELPLERFDLAKLNAKESALVGMVSSIRSALSARDAKAQTVRDETYEMSTSVRRALSNADDLLKRAGNR